MRCPRSPAPLAHRVPDLGALELLLAVARLGSLGGAARELGITQPAASSRIRSMERLLGVALVDRSPRGSRLTAGALVTDWARRVVEAAEAFDAGAQALRDRRDSRLRVAASMTIAEYLLPGWLIALRAERPDTAVSLHAGNSAVVAERLLSPTRRTSASWRASACPRAWTPRSSAMTGCSWSRPPAHPWARRRAPLTPAELAATPLILRERGFGHPSGPGRGARRVRRPRRPAARTVLDHRREGGRGQRGGALGPERTGGGRGAGRPPSGAGAGGGRRAPSRPARGLAQGPASGRPGPRPAVPDAPK